jgi:hypothetical protein
MILADFEDNLISAMTELDIAKIKNLRIELGK